MRITAQLIDAPTGKHLWAKRYDRDLNDVFAIQDEITMKVITELQVTLTAGEQARIFTRGTDNLEAYLKFLKGRETFHQYHAQANTLARQMFTEAILFLDKVLHLNPYPPSWYWRFAGAAYRWVGQYDDAISAVEQNLENAPNDINAHIALATIYGFMGREEEVRAEVTKALGINPKYSLRIFISTIPYKNKSDKGRLISVLRKAGLPD